MAEKNYSSSQESLPLSEESCLYLLKELGSPLNEFVNIVSGLSGANVLDNQEYPTVVETVNTSPKAEYSILGEVTNSCLSVPQIEPGHQYLLENAVPEQKVAPSSLPAIESWPGDYDFNVTFRMQLNVKGAQCVYSKLKNKLYVGKDVPCPINFSTNTIMTEDVYIRAMALFSSADNASQVVHRCVNHSMAELQKNLPEAEHLVRCESRSAVYVNDPITGRHSVVIPFENAPAGQEFSSYIYKFTCFGSCSGGPNRRPLILVFTLERGGAVIGRQKVDLKICACPSRDMKLDEKQNYVNKKALKRKSLDTAMGTIVDTVPNFHSAVKKMRPVPETGPYHITVQDKNCYEFLKLMKTCFFLYTHKQLHGRKTTLMNFIRSTFSSSEDEGSER